MSEQVIDSFKSTAIDLGNMPTETSGSNKTPVKVVDMPEIDSFKSDVVKLPPKKEQKSEEDKIKELKKYPDADKKSQKELLPDNDGSKDAGKTEKNSGKEVKSDAKDEGKEKLPPSKVDGVEETKDDGKKNSSRPVKTRIGSEEYELPADTKFRQKVDGKMEEFTLRDLLNQKVGNVSVEKRFQEINTEKQKVYQERDQFHAERDAVVNHLKTIASMLDDPEKDPTEVLDYLVDISGRDPLQWNKRVQEHRLKELQQLSEMSAEQQALYWKDKEIQFLRNQKESSVRQTETVAKAKQFQSHVDKLREAHKVSEDQFVSAANELEAEGIKGLSPEMVIQRAVMKPFFDKAEKVTAGFEEDLSSEDYDSLVTETAKLMKDFPHFSEEESVKHAAKRLGYDVEEVNDNINALQDKLSRLPGNFQRKDNSSADPRKIYKGKVSRVDDIEIESFEKY